MKRKRYSGFTLLEVLTVISIIGILSAILYPAVGAVIGKARKSTASNNLHQIAIAANSYMRSGTSRTIRADTPQDWAFVLAKYEGLNDASLYILKDDDLANAQISQAPEQICFVDASGVKSINSDFENFPLSFAFVSNLSVSAPESTTPIAWTRGLQENGYWASQDSSTPSVYGSEGGHIVFLDGHVVYYESLVNEDDTGKLVDYETRRPTFNILDAISPNATVLESQSD